MPPKFVSYSETVNSAAIRTSEPHPKYRIGLTRVWDESLPVVVFLCLNPSFADELYTDTTVSTCGNLAASWRGDFGGYTVLNLYPHYATEPKDCEKTGDAAEKNAKYVAREIRTAHTVVICCGNGQKERLKQIFSLLGKNVKQDNLFCLKKNLGGGFLHPRNVTLTDIRNRTYQVKGLVKVDLQREILQ